MEIGRDVQPISELVPLALGGGLFLVDCGIETLSERLLCSMEVSFCLHAGERRISRQVFYCGEVKLKWRRKSWSDRFVR